MISRRTHDIRGRLLGIVGVGSIQDVSLGAVLQPEKRLC